MDHEHDLIRYIKEARNAKISHHDILKVLIENGWRMSEVVGIIFDHWDAMPQLVRPLVPITETTPAISIQNIIKSFDGVRAVDGISFTVAPGTVTALLGPNGAGKTTLVRMLATLLTPDSGSAQIFGHDVVHEDHAVRTIVGLTGQYTAVDDILTGRENLEMIGQLYHMSTEQAQQRSQELLEKFDLLDAADRSSKTYSGGMRRRLDLAASIIGKPKLLFLDEPTTGLDPHSRIRLWEIIKELVAEGTTILLTTQYLEEADHLADQIIVIDHGTVIAHGTSDELKQQVGGDVLEFHLENHEDAHRAAAIVGHEIPGSEPWVHTETGKVSMPADHGASTLINTVRILDGAGLKIADIVLRRPTLDDVFLSLTGHDAETGSVQ